jgi:hypothetical protein
MAEGGENLPTHPEIWMIHMRVFECFRQAQGCAAKIVGCHFAISVTSQSPQARVTPIA